MRLGFICGALAGIIFLLAYAIHVIDGDLVTLNRNLVVIAEGRR